MARRQRLQAHVGCSGPEGGAAGGAAGWAKTNSTGWADSTWQWLSAHGWVLARWAWWPPEHAGAAAGAGWGVGGARSPGNRGGGRGSGATGRASAASVFCGLLDSVWRMPLCGGRLRARGARGPACAGAGGGGPGPNEAMCGAAGGACELRASHNALRGRFSQCTHWATAIRL